MTHNPHSKIVYPTYILGLLLMACLAQTALAQNNDHDYKVGDQVEVRFQREWIPAKITKVTSVLIVAEFDSDSFGGRKRNLPFRFEDVRPLNPKADSIASSDYREWSSANGKFKVKARLQKIENDAVFLVREDDATISVKIEALSQSDRDFLNQLKENENPFNNVVNKRPKTRSTTNSTRERNASGSDSLKLVTADFSNAQPFAQADSSDWSLASSAMSGYKLKASIDFTFKSRHPFVESSWVVPSQERIFLAMKAFGNDPPELVCLDAKAGKQLFNYTFPTNKTLVGDISPDGTKLVTYSSDVRNSRIDLWNINEKDLSHEKGWMLSGESKPGFHNAQKLKFIDNQRLVVVDRKSKLTVWNMESAQQLHQTSTTLFMNGFLVSPDRKHLVFVQDKEIKIVNIDRGEIVASIATPFRHQSIAVSQSGKIAAISGSRVKVWSNKGEPLNSFSIPKSVQGRSLEWIDEKFLLASAGGTVSAIDTENRVLLVRYLLNGSGKVDRQGKLWISKATRNSGSFGSQVVDPAIYQMALPGLADELLIFREGSEAKLDIDLPFDGEKITAIENNLTQQLQDLGASVVAESDLVLRLRVRKGKSRDISMRSIFAHPFRGGSRVKVTPSYSTLELVSDGKVLYSQQATNDVFGMIRMQDGESEQQAVDRMTRPSPTFFTNLKLDRNIAKHPAEGCYAIVNLGLDGVTGEKIPSID